MQLQAIELLRLDLTLRHSLATSAGAHSARPVLLVVAHAGEATGYGECEALAEPTYTEEYADGAEAVLATHLVPRLLAKGELESTAAAMEGLAAVRGHRMAKAGLEMALLDAELRLAGRSLAEHLGATATAVPAGANVSLGEAASVVAEVAEAVAAGYRRVKCKIAPGRDLESLRAVRSTFPDLVLSADANGAYDLGDAGHVQRLRAIDDVGLAALEQPLRADDLLGHARLAAEMVTPVMLDESVESLGGLEVALSLSACDAVSVKAARLGGLLQGRAVHDRCREAGVHLAIGGMLESGLGRAAAIALGALPGFDLPGDLGASERYFAPDLTLAHDLVDGALAVPTGPGLGRTPLPEVLAAALVRSTLLEGS
ncbi:MAG TPA: o-succinylbenzoate synthase [Acidimicrobiales bacterium]|nr:o-succinylbenzoate synthase [Acidimicrobiales bacterium]